MFDALELTWQNTLLSNVISELYEGKMKDCVQCLQVAKQPLMHCVTVNIDKCKKLNSLKQCLTATRPTSLN